MPRKKQPVEVKIPTIVKLVFEDFDNLPEDSTVTFSDMKSRSPWANKPKPKGRGRANSHSQFNTAINKEINAGRALASALEHQHKITFG